MGSSQNCCLHLGTRFGWAYGVGFLFFLGGGAGGEGVGAVWWYGGGISATSGFQEQWCSGPPQGPSWSAMPSWQPACPTWPTSSKAALATGMRSPRSSRSCAICLSGQSLQRGISLVSLTNITDVRHLPRRPMPKP